MSIRAPAPRPRDTPLLSLGFCLAVAAALRFALLWGYDLRGSFGPDAPGAAAAASTGVLAHPYPLHPVAIRVLALLTRDAALAALLLSLVAGIVAVGAAWLLGRVLTDGRDGRATALLAAVAPLLVQDSLLGGGDAFALALAWWGVALAFWGASVLADPAWSARRAPPVALLVAGLLWGLSAAAKPIALPAGALLPLAALLGGRRSLPWLLGGMAGGALLAWPFLGPLLDPMVGAGLLGSWWQPAPPALVELPGWLAGGASALLALGQGDGWARPELLGLVACLGVAVGAPRRGLRLALLLVGGLSMLLVAAALGEQLRPRYLASASLGWLLLAGVLSTPRHLRLGQRGRQPARSRLLLGPLPLAALVGLLLVSNLRYWDGMALLRAQEEGSWAPRGVFADWAGSWRPLADYADASICGALELERIALELAGELPEGSSVLVPPLRDGRSWHLLGPLATRRDDLVLLELSEACCPGGHERCRQALPGALARAGGGALVLPLSGATCQTGALPAGWEPWLSAGDPPSWRWYGVQRVPAAGSPGSAGICTLLGGERPQAPARP